MRKISRVQKIAWSIVLRLAGVKKKFEYGPEKLPKMVRNPNPKGRKEWVTQEYADLFLNKPKSTGPVQVEAPATQSETAPRPGKERADFNKKRLQEIKKQGGKNTHKFLGLDANTTEKVKKLASKKGSEITKEDIVEYVKFFEEAFEEVEGWAEDFIKRGGASKYAGRWKDENSLFDKMKRPKFLTRSLDSVGDIIGNRCVCRNASEQKRLIDYIYENCLILEHDNSVDGDVRPDGYRAHHFTIQTSDGRLVELQVKTKNQQLYSGWTHSIYKSPLMQKDAQGNTSYPEVQKYMKALSDYIYEVDCGRNPPMQPKPPKALVYWLRQQGKDLFNFNELERGA